MGVGVDLEEGVELVCVGDLLRCICVVNIGGGRVGVVCDIGFVVGELVLGEW